MSSGHTTQVKADFSATGQGRKKPEQWPPRIQWFPKMMYIVQESQLLTEPGFHRIPLWNDFPLSGCKI